MPQLRLLRWATDRRLAAIGALALMAGLAVYRWGRPALAADSGLAPLVWGAAPSFFHGLAFALWTVVALGMRGKSAWVVAGCSAALQALIEAFQLPGLHGVLPAAWAARWQGTFDPWDLGAGLAGAALAATLATGRPLRHHPS